MNTDKKTEKEIRNGFDKLSKDYFDATLKSVANLYIDMECFQDFNIGAILLLIKTAEEYRYVLSQMEKYNNRKTNNTLLYFPELDITEKQLSEFISNMDNWNLLEKISPMTEYYSMFHIFGKVVDRCNSLTMEKVKPKIFIGFTRIQYSDIAKKMLLSRLKEFFPHWDIIITDSNIYSYSKELLSNMDHFSIYDIEKFLTDKKIGKVVKKGEAVVNRSIHAFPFITTTSEEYTEEQLLQNTEIVCNLFSDFKYIIPGVKYGKE